MLDPFLNDAPSKVSKLVNEEQIAQRRGRTISGSATPKNWIWRLGNLLIKIGTKLTKENSTMSSANRSA